MEIEQLEQIAAVIVTAGLVAGNFLMFTPWRNGEDPRQRPPESLMPQNESFFQIAQGEPLTHPSNWIRDPLRVTECTYTGCSIVFVAGLVGLH